jgi:hypothetical protein
MNTKLTNHQLKQPATRPIKKRIFHSVTERVPTPSGRVEVSLFTIHFLLLLAACQSISAQPWLNFKRITLNQQTVSCFFEVSCNGLPTRAFDKTDFTVKEDGTPVQDFTLEWPINYVRCPISVALVCDESSRMSIGNPTGTAGEMTAGHAFVDVMDHTTDEAIVIGFNETSHSLCGWTKSKSSLDAGIDWLASAGKSAMYDAAYAGLLAVINNASNQCRAVILMTDGFDSASTKTAAEVIALANKNRLRIFPVGIGRAVNTPTLQNLADKTGGKLYLWPTAGNMASMYQEITTIIFICCINECIITYQSSCMDGTTRTVELGLPSYCGGSVAKSKTYTALRDTSTFTQVHLQLERKTERRDTATDLELRVAEESGGTILKPSSFTVTFNKAV